MQLTNARGQTVSLLNDDRREARKLSLLKEAAAAAGTFASSGRHRSGGDGVAALLRASQRLPPAAAEKRTRGGEEIEEVVSHPSHQSHYGSRHQQREPTSEGDSGSCYSSYSRNSSRAVLPGLGGAAAPTSSCSSSPLSSHHHHHHHLHYQQHYYQQQAATPSHSSCSSSLSTTHHSAAGSGATAAAATAATAVTATNTTSLASSSSLSPPSLSPSPSSQYRLPSVVDVVGAPSSSSSSSSTSPFSLEPLVDSSSRYHSSVRRDRLPPLSSISSSGRSPVSLPYHTTPSSSATNTNNTNDRLQRPPLRHQSAFSIDSRKSSYSSNASHTDGSSCESPRDIYDSPCFSPDAQITPQLQRNDSGSSSRSLSTPSPMTPTYGFDPLDQSKQGPLASGLDPYVRRNPGPYFAAAGQPPLAAMADPSSFFPLQNAAVMPPVDAAAPAYALPVTASTIPIVPYPTDLIRPSPQFNPTLAGASPPNPNAAASDQSSPSGAPQQQKARKKYPCPHAARYGCTDTFTTSGHAARHGKKHTGEKNIHCPTCHKAFTRKDNMKQHERTHRNNRDSVGSATDASSKRGKTSHASSNSITNASTTAGTDSAPGSALPKDMDLDPTGFDPSATLRASSSSSRPGVLSPSNLDFHGLNGTQGVVGANSVFMDADFEAGGPSPGDDELRYGHMTDMNHVPKRPAGVKREISQGGTSQDGEGESPGLDALAMAASGFS